MIFKDTSGTTIFEGCQCYSCGARTSFLASQEALVEALVKAKELGFQNIIGLTDSRNMEQVWYYRRKPQ